MLTPIELAGFPASRASCTAATSPPVLFLHGIMGSHLDFHPLMTHLASTGIQSYAFARRGRPGVSGDIGTVRFADYLTDTMAVLDALGRDVVVVGHSLGGLIAQKTAELGRCSAAILVASAPPAGIRLPPSLVALPLCVEVIPSVLRSRPHRMSYRFVSAAMAQRVPPVERRALHERLVPESPLVLRELTRGVPVDAGKIRCPVRVLGGVQDRIFPPRVTRAIANWYATEPVMLQDADHWLIDEPGYERVADAIIGCLDQVR